MVEKGEFHSAVALSKELLTLRQRVQGNDHWQTTSQQWDLRLLQRRAEFTKEQQAEFQRGEANAQKAEELEAQAQYPEAYPLREQVLTVRRKLLGEEHPHTAAAYDHLAINQGEQAKYVEVMDGVPLEVLTDQNVFSRVSSATLFTLLRHQPRPVSNGLLALADPIFDRPELAKAAPLPPGGLLLTAVVPGSNAHKAGLRAGNVLLRYRDKPLECGNSLSLSYLLDRQHPDTKLSWTGGEAWS